jgi:hypothetical protein
MGDALLELALRCEQATGDSFDLNHAIAAALGIASEPFTASLDAAMQLVPEGFRFSVGDQYEGTAWASVCPLDGTKYLPATANTDAANPALALCAASLRARAKEAS